MKTQTQNAGEQQATGRMSRLFLTGMMLLCLTAGWLLASITNEAFSQPSVKNAKVKGATLMSIPLNGETLPTMMLNEFAVIADQNLKK